MYAVHLPKGNSAARIIARLKRDAPHIAERLAAGEFKSAAAAVRRVDIHSVDHAGKAETLRVTLYGITGEQGIPEVPITYLKVERDAQ